MPVFLINQYSQLIQDASGCLRAACAAIVKPPTYTPGQRTLACENCTDLASAASVITQKRIQRTVRTSGSAYTESLAPQHVHDPALQLTMQPNGSSHWNQASDRAVAGVVTRNVPSRGASSVHGSVSRARPGATSAPGSGVDIKHGSYARYLAKLKGRTVARSCASTQSVLMPLHGNKTQYYSIAAAASCNGAVRT
jgi:hypothetical protein